MEKQMQYNQENINRIYDTLLNAMEQGKPRDFEIRADGFTIVQRTDDVEQFLLFDAKHHLSSQCVTFILYYGKSRHSDKYILGNQMDQITNNALTVDEIIQEELKKRNEEQKLLLLKKENKQLKKVNRSQRKKIKELRSKQFDIKEIIPLISQFTSTPKQETESDQSLGGIPVNLIITQLKKLCTDHGEEKVKDGIMMLLTLLPQEELMEKVKQIIITYETEKAA